MIKKMAGIALALTTAAATLTAGTPAAQADDGCYAGITQQGYGGRGAAFCLGGTGKVRVIIQCTDGRDDVYIYGPNVPMGFGWNTSEAWCASDWLIVWAGYIAAGV